MTYIDLINRFWKLNRLEPFAPSDLRLYFYLLDQCNIRGWENPFKLSTRYIECELKMSRKVIEESRERLHNRGLIEFTKGIGSSTPTYIIKGVEISGNHSSSHDYINKGFPSANTKKNTPAETHDCLRGNHDNGLCNEDRNNCSEAQINSDNHAQSNSQSNSQSNINGNIRGNDKSNTTLYNKNIKTKTKTSDVDINISLTARGCEEGESIPDQNLTRFDSLLQELRDGKHQIWTDTIRKKFGIEDITSYLPSFREHAIANDRIREISSMSDLKQYFVNSFRFFSRVNPVNMLGEYERDAKDRGYADYCRWIRTCCPNIDRGLVPLSEKEYHVLISHYGGMQQAIPLMRVALVEINEREDIIAKYYSTFHIITRWIKNDRKTIKRGELDRA